MATVQKESSLADCDEKALEQFLTAVKLTVKEIKEFNLFFTEFLERQKKLSKDLWNWVTRYNILDSWEHSWLVFLFVALNWFDFSGPPCVYPIIQKEELLQEILVKIQDLTSTIIQSL